MALQQFHRDDSWGHSLRIQVLLWAKSPVIADNVYGSLTRRLSRDSLIGDRDFHRLTDAVRYSETNHAYPLFTHDR